MSRETESRFPGRRTTGATLFLWSALAVLQGSCGTQQISTPTRSLDRPSDAALFCVDYDLDYTDPVTGKQNNCLPRGDKSNPQQYLDDWCADIYWRDITPTATVLALNDCDQSHVRLHNETYLKDVRDAARALGRDPEWPCCPSDNLGCGTKAPACTRRAINMVIANTSRGELAVANTQLQPPGLTTTGRLENLHGGQPGYGFLPTGILPEHVRAYSPPADKLPDGSTPAPSAWAVTTNVGSCDLSVVELPAVVQLSRRADSCDDSAQTCATHGCDDSSCPRQWRPWYRNSSGNKVYLSARPGWVEIAPPPWADAVSRPVFIAYPTCGLVAVINLERPLLGSDDPGLISEAIGFNPTDPSKPPHVLSAAELQNLQCPSDCGGDGSPLMPDPNQLPATGAPQPKSYPATLAVDTEGHRLLIGDQVASALTVVDLDLAASTGSHLLGQPRQIALDFQSRNLSLPSGHVGINVVRVTPRTEAGRFAYVTAHDDTVRVIDLDREIECETNPDPRYLMQQAGSSARVLPDEYNESNLRRLSCIPVSATTPRRPMSASPGITLPNGSVPFDIGFVHQDTAPCNYTDPTNPDPTLCTYLPYAQQTSWLRAAGSVWVGDFGWVLGGAGGLLGVQISDNCPQPSYRACYADCGAQRRFALLHTRSQELPTPETYNLPAQPQALMVSPLDRLGNVARNYSRFEDQTEATAGPRIDIDSEGLPIYTGQIGTAFTPSLYNNVPGANNQLRRQLIYPAPAPYYYLPVDPVCDVAISAQATDMASPDTILPSEPTRRPVSTVAFTDPQSATSETWSLAWEGVLSTQLQRQSGRMLPNGQMIDLNGLYCSRGVEQNDKLWLTGCLSNADCQAGTLCLLEQAQGTAPGVCLANQYVDQCRTLSQRLMLDSSHNTEWATTWLRRYRIKKAQQQVPALTAGSDIVDVLTLDEIAEPEFELERKPCDVTTQVGQKCDHYQTWVLPRHAPMNTALEPHETYCRVTGVDNGAATASCIMQCSANTDCGDGFVCAMSIYDTIEEAPPINRPKQKPDDTHPLVGRCVRAPLVTAQTQDTTQNQIGPAAAAQLIQNCFPDLLHYEVRGGDAFVVSGSTTGSPILEERNSTDGSCVKPAAGDPQFWAGRMLQPRLRLGPFDSTDDPTKLCPDQTQWISHRVPHSAQAASAASCQFLLNNGARSDDGSEVFGCSSTSSCAPAGDGLNWSGACNCTADCTCSTTGTCTGGGNITDFCSGTGTCTCSNGGHCFGVTGIVLPEGNSTQPLSAVQGGNFMPKPPDQKSEQTASSNQDPWLNREYELFSILPFSSATNQCVLTTTWEEESNVTTVAGNKFHDDENYDQNCTGFCRFPGDHTEIGGVRRIHYENSIGNMVMRVPRDPLHPSNPPKCAGTGPVPGIPCDPAPLATPDPPRWSVPIEGYLVSFLVYGGLTPYTRAAQTSQRDVSSGMLAQSLKAAIPALDGILYLIDEGRNGSPAGLRGQVMRVIGSLVDPYFLLR